MELEQEQSASRLEPEILCPFEFYPEQVANIQESPFFGKFKIVKQDCIKNEIFSVKCSLSLSEKS